MRIVGCRVSPAGANDVAPALGCAWGLLQLYRVSDPAVEHIALGSSAKGDHIVQHRPCPGITQLE